MEPTSSKKVVVISVLIGRPRHNARLCSDFWFPDWNVYYRTSLEAVVEWLASLTRTESSCHVVIVDTGDMYGVM